MKTLLAITMLCCAATAARATEETLEFGRFGAVHIYAPGGAPAREVALFVSGDGGWNQGVVDMARELASMNVLVAGIDITHYLEQLSAPAEKCDYPAGDFEALGQFIQKRRGDAAYRKPVLVGYSSGATLVYAVLVQSPSTTFKGALSLGFCPDLPLARPLCRGSGLEWGPGPRGRGVSFLPSASLAVPWIALQGAIDQVCDANATRQFVAKTAHAEIVMLPGVGHGYSVPRNWLPQFRAAFERIAQSPDTADPPAATAASLSDLPLHEVTANVTGGRLLCLHVTGDGGYGVTDKGVAEGLARRGVPTVVLNSLHYFWNERTPQQTTDDVARILRHYLSTWQKDGVVLVGYSRGADVLPFVVSRLPDDLRRRVRLVVLLGAGEQAEFELTLTGWFGHHPPKYPVLPEIEKLRGTRILCFYGKDDRDAVGPRIDPGLATVIPVDGGHRFGSNYEHIVDAILREAGVKS